MKIGTKERVGTIIVLGAIGLSAAMLGWTYHEVNVANSQRQRVSEIARELSKLRLVTFEYRLYHTERAKLQWYAVSARLDQLIANADLTAPQQEGLLANVRERRVKVRGLFTELTSAYAGPGTGAPLDEATRRFEGQVLTRLLSYQQENFTDVFRLTDIASQRIDAAQQRMAAVVLAGLLLIAVIKSVTSYLLNRDVLRPIVQIQDATMRVAAGQWDAVVGLRRNDEIGQLSRNFDAMTASLRQAFEQAESSNRALAALNEELEAFSYSVSHDLRAPLRSVDGFSRALLEDYGDKLDADGVDALQRIQSASERMDTLIEDLLRLAKVNRTELRLAPVDLSALAHEIAEGIDQAHESAATHWQIDPGITVRADRALLRIALQNLLQNAWKFSRGVQDPRVRVGATHRGDEQVVSVADNGVGFDMAHADHLFQAFQRLHDARDFPGTGIGLAIVQRIIRRHGGQVWAEARPNAGASIFFTMKEDS